MSDLTAKFSALEEQLATQAATIEGYTDTVEAKLQAIFDELDLILINNAANTKYLLAALGQTAACFPCPTPSIVVPPIGTTPGAVDTDRCQRAQAIIAVIHSLLADMDTLQSFNVVGTFNVLNDAITEAIAAVVAGDTVPLPSFPEVVQLGGTYINYAGERAFSGVGLIDQFEPLEADLRDAIYFTGTPGQARDQYETVIGASGASSGAKQLFSAIAYTALWSYYFDPASTPDVSAYSGSACGGDLASITSCTLFAAVSSTFSGHTWYRILLPPPSVPDGLGIDGDYFGWTIEYTTTFDTIHNVGIGGYDSGGTFHLETSGHQGDSPYTIVNHRESLYIFTIDVDGDAHPFTVTICPP